MLSWNVEERLIFIILESQIIEKKVQLKHPDGCRIWQMVMDLLHSNRQQRTERDGDTEKGCQNPLHSRRLLMMMELSPLPHPD